MRSTPSPSLPAFALLAKEFCAWCEAGPLGAAPELILSRWFSQLYAAGLLLAEVEAEELAPDSLATDISAGEASIRPLLGYYYRVVFDPDPRLTEEPCIGDVGDDLLDVYRDVKRGSALYDLGFPRAAECTWAFDFRAHWGRHAAGAISALHGMTPSKFADLNSA